MGREVGRPCHAGPRRCSTDARCGSCAAASYLAAFRYPHSRRRGLAGRCFRALLARRRSWGSVPFAGLLPRAGRSGVSIRHAPLAVWLPVDHRSFSPAGRGPVIASAWPRSDRQTASASGVLPVRDPAPTICRSADPALGFGPHSGFRAQHHVHLATTRPRESPAPAPGFPGLSAHGFTAPRWCRLPDLITGSIRLPGRYPGVAGPSACYVADALPTRRC
jgi:hypothetical protein